MVATVPVPPDSAKVRAVTGVFGALLASGVGFFFLTTALGDRLVFASYDLPFKFRPWILPREVVMVYLDDASHEKLQQNYTQPWNRAYYTKLLNRLTGDHAKAVVFDIVFSDSMDPATDQALAKAIERNGSVVIGAEMHLASYDSNNPALFKRALSPTVFDKNAADLGLTTVYPDRDLEIREYLPTSKLDGASPPISSEAWAAALLANPALFANGTLQTSPFWMNYYGPERRVLPFVSFYQAVADSDLAVPPGYFSNKVVFVGQKLHTQLSASRMDECPTPYSYLAEDKFMSGVAIHATACLNLLRGDYLRRLDWITERIIILAFGAIVGAGLVFLRPLQAVGAALVSVTLIALADYYCFAEWHLWFPCLVPTLVQIPMALIWSVVANYTRLYAQFRASQNATL